MTGQPLLRVADLEIRFGSAAPVVAGISFEVGSGEVVALVGESGSGKTLTARSILGLLPDGASARGSAVLDGIDTLTADPAVLRSIRGTRAAMVFQEPQTALDPVRRVGRQIAGALRAHQRVDGRTARRRAVELLRQVEIPDPERRVDWYPHQLSGGQRQRVVIALALAGDPDLLIADEPTTALDVTVQAEILDLLHRLRSTSGMSILLITHNLGVVADLADRVVVLRRGEVVEQRPVDELFGSPASDYTRELLGAVPRLREVTTRPDTPGAVARDSTSTSNSTEAPVPALRVDDVSVVYPARLGTPRFSALEHISLTVAPGEVIGVVGESGSGKTTLGRAALGLVPVSAGVVEVDGSAYTNLSRERRRHVRRNVALVHQDPASSLDPRRTVGESIGEPLRVHRSARGAVLADRVAALLDSVELPVDFAGRRPGELSGGQRQRVALARALSLSPRLLVADEPTSALDVSVQARVLDLFESLREQYEFACLFISHDLAVVDRVADRVLVLRAGHAVESGITADVFAAPRAAYTRDLLAALPAADPTARRARRAAFGGDGQASIPVVSGVIA